MIRSSIVRLMRIVCRLDVCKDSVYFCILGSIGVFFEKQDGVFISWIEKRGDWGVRVLCRSCFCRVTAVVFVGCYD